MLSPFKKNYNRTLTLKNVSIYFNATAAVELFKIVAGFNPWYF